MTLGQLALHGANVPGFVAVATHSPFPISEFKQPSATSAAELIPTLDQRRAVARGLLGGLRDADLAGMRSIPALSPARSEVSLRRDS